MINHQNHKNVISDESAYKLVLGLLFRNGLYLPIYLQKYVIYIKGVYKLGLMLLFRYEVLLSIYSQRLPTYF